ATAAMRISPISQKRLRRESVMPRESVSSESRALELLFQVTQAQAQRGRPAVRAVARAVDQLPPGEQRLDLRRRERVAGLHRRLARHHVQDFVEQLLLVHVEQLLFAALEQLAHEISRLQPLEK